VNHHTEDPFDVLFGEVMAGAGRFGHRQHIHLAWLAVRRLGVPDAVRVIGDGIRRAARYAEAPQKYHATITRAWVELVGYHAEQDNQDGFDAFVDRFPPLLNKRLLTGHYRSATLASDAARSGWVEPDIKPLPRAQRDHAEP
jgi:hypothetical protein